MNLGSLWRRRHAPWVMLWPLAVAQLVSWGTLYYSFPLFVGPMLDELGWPVAAANGALTVGLLVTGLVAYPVATVLDRRGGRRLMTLGSIGAGVKQRINITRATSASQSLVVPSGDSSSSVGG